MRRVRMGLLAGGLALAAISCAVSDSEAAVDGTKRQPPPAPVQVATVVRQTLTDRWVFLGEVQAISRAQLSAGADAEVVVVTPRVGDRVEAGDVVAKLDVRLAKARVAAARASKTATSQELAQAERDRQRAQDLGRTILPEAEIERDVTRAQTLADRTAALEAAEREAKAQLGRHRVVAPFSGVVAARFVDPGDWVAPGSPVVELVDDQRVEIVVAGSEDLVARVAVGDTATVTRGEQRVSLRVAGIVRALDPTTRTAALRLVPAEVPAWMLPGASLDVEFSIVRDEDGVVVPRDALVYGAVGVRVVRVTDGAAAPLPVEVLATVDDSALVTGEGLEPGDTVVVRGNERLRPGQPVAMTPSETKAP